MHILKIYVSKLAWLADASVWMTLIYFWNLSHSTLLSVNHVNIRDLLTHPSLLKKFTTTMLPIQFTKNTKLVNEVLKLILHAILCTNNIFYGGFSDINTTAVWSSLDHLFKGLQELFCSISCQMYLRPKVYSFLFFCRKLFAKTYENVPLKVVRFNFEDINLTSNILFYTFFL